MAATLAKDTFKCISLNEIFNITWNFTKICYLASNWQYGNIRSYNGLAPNMRQAIIWSNVGMLYWRIYAPLAFNELMLRGNFLTTVVISDDNYRDMAINVELQK